METVLASSGGTARADHLCVLVHGLWGNPAHMAQVAKALRDRYSRDQLYIIVAKRNSGSFTYDGIELGGQRVCREIEEELEKIKKTGGKITKISFIGYSMGGLVARYAIGLLEAKGVLEKLQCINFTAFASPFLGCRTPLKGWNNHLFNVLGARTLSLSGRQLFGIDKFRDTGRPLIAVMTDQESIFMSGLRRFKRHTLYSNIVNDRAAVYYTTSISKTDPFVDLDKVKLNFVEGYENVILDPDCPVRPKERVAPTAFKALKNAPFFLAMAVLLPIGITAFLLNAGVQTARSSKRLRAHRQSHDSKNYSKLPLWVKEVRGALEDAYENLNSSQRQEFLASETPSEDEGAGGAADDRASTMGVEKAEDDSRLALERKQSHAAMPTLALAPYQFSMIDSLDSLGWRKYRVWIQKNNHSHAAIIVRIVRDSYSEGYQVLKHWLDNEFII
ncbi:hypothetical protein MGG_06006 [Pyricularia oryzae 70-15]|uniref:DUF676 domain-containing protein n=3 Tax=Pyricularia oryzae TaxID=318829 RepID=G4N4N0_PYRO7|nr:uncharacterized protein MGG_06006 [Pyricularia oryzae 70-15]EHA52045.1 hypothetical protein MGG_06006 [Pyricularia oryzae 70-15]ELQ39930.1 hypothetical protein OOU_Y34scaffold00464g12 [Pyricularia oryzae Y34]KAI7915425.1 hypothetical protein M0657_009077 [Pyricularia oryzae]KAI7928201.1 hypothetical protein M9X92_001889 [Pyricularia oryzae]